MSPLAPVRGEGDTSDHPRLDECGLDEIAALHGPHLHATAVRLTGDKDAANDLVQETLLRALRHFDRFKQGTNARAWLVTIMTRLYYDQRKHEQVVQKAEPELMTLSVVEWELELMPPEISEARLWAAIQKLDPDLRDVVECCYVRGLSYKDAAVTLNVPIGTISTRLMRARARLKALLTEDV